ncbi:MAG: cyclase family protein [Actinomycetota bacterium]
MPRVVDLTQPLGPATPGWPGEAPLAATVRWTVAADGAYGRRIDLPEHLGTHFEAPAHFAADGATVEAIAADRLVVPARVIDIAARCADDPDAVLTAADVEAHEAEHGPLPAGAALLARTGWDRHLGDPARYVGDLRFPGFGADAAALAVARGLAGIGIDTLSVDRGADAAFPVHRTALPAGLWQLEGLVGLDALPPSGTTLVVGVPPVVAASGFPARVLALVSDRPDAGVRLPA